MKLHSKVFELSEDEIISFLREMCPDETLSINKIVSVVPVNNMNTTGKGRLTYFTLKVEVS